jgi:hypothetical protein
MPKNQQDLEASEGEKTTKSRTVRLDEDIVKALDRIGEEMKKKGIKDPSYSQIIHYALFTKQK